MWSMEIWWGFGVFLEGRKVIEFILSSGAKLQKENEGVC
ncbi:hypothetical protein ACUXCC_000834 [Cytobacillus horneckiae]